MKRVTVLLFGVLCLSAMVWGSDESETNTEDDLAEMETTDDSETGTETESEEEDEDTYDRKAVIACTGKPKGTWCWDGQQLTCSSELALSTLKPCSAGEYCPSGKSKCVKKDRQYIANGVDCYKYCGREMDARHWSTRRFFQSAWPDAMLAITKMKWKPGMADEQKRCYEAAQASACRDAMQDALQHAKSFEKACLVQCRVFAEKCVDRQCLKNPESASLHVMYHYLDACIKRQTNDVVRVRITADGPRCV